jgi:hypothetical protein
MALKPWMASAPFVVVEPAWIRDAHRKCSRRATRVVRERDVVCPLHQRFIESVMAGVSPARCPVVRHRAVACPIARQRGLSCSPTIDTELGPKAAHGIG